MALADDTGKIKNNKHKEGIKYTHKYEIKMAS